MKRVILDTNIYGYILDFDEPEKFKERIASSDIVIYGVNVIRKELRNVPKKATIFDRSLRVIRNLRASLLALYDTVTKKEYDVSDKMKALALSYYDAYREIGGKETWDEMETDFLIIACASMHNLDIVVSQDKSTMLSDPAIKSYKIVNKLKNYRTPEFIGYEDFRRLLP